MTWHNVALAKWQLVRRAWCELCRSTERVQKYTDGTRPWSVCWPTPSDPPCSQDRPKLAHTRVPYIALTACSGAMDATSVSSGASAREQAEQVPLDAPGAYASALPSGIAREAHGRKIRPRDEGTPLAASHSLKAPNGAGHRDAATRLGLFQRPRWRLRVREEPPVASLDSSGAIGGVLELPGDDYFIYGGGEVQGLSGLIRHVCTIYEEKSNLKKMSLPRAQKVRPAL